MRHHRKYLLVAAWLMAAIAACMLITNLPRGSKTTLEFAPIPPCEIRREYDQRTNISVRNTGDRPALIRMRSTHPPDIAAGFVGRGSADEEGQDPVTISPGETWIFPFVLHAPLATADRYDIPLEILADAAHGRWRALAKSILPVTIRAAGLEVTASWLDPVTDADAVRMTRTLEVINVGDPVPDLYIAPSGDIARYLTCFPVVENESFPKDARRRVTFRPRLTPDFKRLEGKILIRGNNRTQEVPYKVELAKGKRVFVVITRSTSVGRNTGTRCTNRRSVDYSLPTISGTPSSWEYRPEPIRTADQGEPEKTSDEKPEDRPGDGWGGGLDWFCESVPPPTDRNRDDAGITDNATIATDGVTDTVRPDAWGEPVPPADRPLGRSIKSDPFAKMKAAIDKAMEDGTFADLSAKAEKARSGPPPEPAPNTRDVVVRRDGDEMDMLVHRSARSGDTQTHALDYICAMPKGKRLKASIPVVSGNRPISDPTLSTGPEGGPLIAYSQPDDKGKCEIIARTPDGGSSVTLGNPEVDSVRPELVPGEDRTDLLWQEGDQIRRSILERGKDASPPEPVLNGVDPERPFRARRTPDGRLAILAGKGDGLVLHREGAPPETIPGQEGDLVIDSDGSPRVAYRQKDGSVAEWRGPSAEPAPLTPAGWKTGRPVLAKMKDGARLLVHRDLEGLPDGEIGGTYARDLKNGEWAPLRASPRLEEPVEGAFVVLNFSLPWQTANYKAMDTTVSLNDHVIGRLKGRVPNGRFAFRVPANLLRLRAAASAVGEPNRVHMDVKGIGPGSFHVTDVCEIYARHALIQDFVVAASEEEAARAASISTEGTRHGQPDLMLTANCWEPPQNARPGDEMIALVGLANSGDRPAEGGPLIVRSGERVIGSAPLPTVEPFEQRIAAVQVRIPDDWKVTEPFLFTVHADVANDANPASNELPFGIFAVPDPKLAGPDSPDSIDDRLLSCVATIALPAEVPVPSGVLWFKIPVPEDGRLRVRAVDVPDNLPLHVGVFGQDGRLIADSGGPCPVRGESAYLRFAVAEGHAVPEGSKVILSWEK
ncbi:MAG: hypothetical protein IT577_05305 [Verrucomicrobiae bacterium]|nr:hypothetical protein [Verrucomicrobiae bacterium]